MLKKATEMAAENQITVRIPITTRGEGKNFGVLAVPGVETHVFVGPFTYKNEEISDNKTCSCPLVRYFHTLFWDDIAIIFW